MSAAYRRRGDKVKTTMDAFSLVIAIMYLYFKASQNTKVYRKLEISGPL